MLSNSPSELSSHLGRQGSSMISSRESMDLGLYIDSMLKSESLQLERLSKNPLGESMESMVNIESVVNSVNSELLLDIDDMVVVNGEVG